MNSSFKIYVTGSYPWIRKILEADGFVVKDSETALPGEDLTAALISADLVLLVHRGDQDDGTYSGIASWERLAFEKGRRTKDLIGIPVIVGSVPEKFRDLFAGISDRRPVELVDTLSARVQLFNDTDEIDSRNKEVLLDVAKRLRRDLTVSFGPTARPSAESGPALKLVRMSLANIGCFDEFSLDLSCVWMTILGDNATGKSTLLRSLALGLCTETEMAGLISKQHRIVRKHGSDKGSIDLQLKDADTGAEFRIRTVLTPGPRGDEKIRKETEPAKNFPWDRLFVCAYGIVRSLEATESHDEYSLVPAVAPIFDDTVRLQNSELVLLREKNGRQRDLEERLRSVLMLDGARFDYTERGIVIHGEWGAQPLRSLSDGYRSTLQWVLDFCAWAIYAGRFGEGGVQGGILLIDELEQHLHPRWQRYIVKRLREQFPTTQFFATTHTPLVAAGTADIDSAQVVRLEGEAGGDIRVELMEPQELWGKRADQILTEAFGLITSRNPGSEDDLDRYAALLGKEPRSATEEEDFQALRTKLKDALSLGETETEREAEKIVEKVLDELNTDLDKEHLDFETRQLLQGLLRPESES